MLRLILLLVLCSMSVSISGINTVRATFSTSSTIYIRANGSIDPPGTPISSLNNVTYTFLTSISYLGNEEAIVVEKDNIVVDGANYTLQGVGKGTGTDLSNRYNVTIKNMNFKTFEYAIRIIDSTDNNILGTNITNSRYGIHLWYDANYNSILYNNVENNEYGIYQMLCSNNTFIGNSMSSNTYNFGVEGWELSYFMNNVDSSNTVDGRPVYYWINKRYMTVPFEAGYVALINCTNITVTNLGLQNNLQGIILHHTEGSAIFKNNIENNSCGIWLRDSSNNNIAKSEYGIRFDAFSSGNRILGNNIENNSIGFQLWTFSSNNIISKNNFMNSNCAIQLVLYSHNNKVFQNNFINNTDQVYSSESISIWDDGYPSGGNYWSDYTGIDSDYDGISDNWYEIDSNNIDHYPLMGMFSSFNTDYGYEVDFVSNSSISDFSFNLSYLPVIPPEAFLAFNVTGETGTEGFVRICIPKALINGSYIVRFDGTIITNMSYPKVRELPCSNETYEYLYINYTHSEHTIVISGTTTIPEFPSFLILPLFIIATLLAVIVYRRKRITSSRRQFHTDL